MAQITTYASSFNNAVPTGFNTQLTNPANAQGAPDATLSITTGTNGQTHGNHFYFADLANIPDGSTINSLTLTARNRISNTGRGDYFYRLDSAPNAQIATEWTPPKVNALQDQSNSTWSTTPTLTELKASTFGVRVRYSRTATQAVQYELDSLAVIVDYTPPVTTVQGAAAISGKATLSASALSYAPLAGQVTLTPVASLTPGGITGKPSLATLAASGVLSATGEVGSGASERTQYLWASFPTPENTLATGPGRQEIRLRAGKAPGAPDNPTFSVELYEAGVAKGQVIAPTEVTSTTGILLSGTFDASTLNDLSGEDVEVRIAVSTTTAEPLGVGEVYDVEWNYDTSPLGYVPVSGQAAMAGDSTLLAQAVGVESGSATIAGQSAASISAVAGAPGAAAISASGTLAASAVAGAIAGLAIGADASAAFVALIAKRVEAPITGYASVSTSAVFPIQGAAYVLGIGSAQASGVLSFRGALAIEGRGAVVATGALAFGGALVIQGQGALSAELIFVGFAWIDPKVVLTVSELVDVHLTVEPLVEAPLCGHAGVTTHLSVEPLTEARLTVEAVA